MDFCVKGTGFSTGIPEFLIFMFTVSFFYDRIRSNRQACDW